MHHTTVSLTRCQTLVLIVHDKYFRCGLPSWLLCTSLFAVGNILHYNHSFFPLCLLTETVTVLFSQDEKELFPCLSLFIHSAHCDESSPILLVRKDKIELCHSYMSHPYACRCG